MILVGRKKFHKVTTYHVLVHCYTVIFFWIHCRFAPGGHGTLDLLTASSTMVEMHLHYLWISLGPSSHSWFRQHLTTFQVVQNLANLSRLIVVLILAPTCDFPWQISLLTFSFETFCFVFFICSYLELYVCPSLSCWQKTNNHVKKGLNFRIFSSHSIKSRGIKHKTKWKSNSESSTVNTSFLG